MSDFDGWAWAGSVSEFLATEDIPLIEALSSHQGHLMQMGAAVSQSEAWRAEIEIMRRALTACIREDANAAAWSIIFEYVLPLEGGRRPDVVVHAGGTIVSLEFKSGAVPTPAFVDQAEAYARDLAEYHQASHGRPVVPILVLAGKTYASIEADRVVIAGSEEVSHTSSSQRLTAQSASTHGFIRPTRRCQRLLRPHAAFSNTSHYRTFIARSRLACQRHCH